MIQESLDQGGDAKQVLSSHMEMMGLSPKTSREGFAPHHVFFKNDKKYKHYGFEG